jgi:hypothetical protein
MDIGNETPWSSLGIGESVDNGSDDLDLLEVAEGNKANDLDAEQAEGYSELGRSEIDDESSPRILSYLQGSLRRQSGGINCYELERGESVRNVVCFLIRDEYWLMDISHSYFDQYFD